MSVPTCSSGRAAISVPMLRRITLAFWSESAARAHRPANSFLSIFRIPSLSCNFDGTAAPAAPGAPNPRVFQAGRGHAPTFFCPKKVMCVSALTD